MKSVLTALLVTVLIVAAVASPADAWHHHHGRVIGPWGLLAAPFVVAGALLAAPFVIAGSVAAAVTPPLAPAPPAMVAPPPAMATAPPVAYWYYCQSPRGYYPYVSQCPTGWLQVMPR